jgi:hypothetical protein
MVDHASMDVKHQIQTLHKELTGRNMDAKMSSYWVSTIANKDKTIDDFASTLLNSDDYVKKMTTLFKDKYFETIDYDLDEQSLNTFLNNYVRGKRVVEEDMLNYITHLPKYIRKYSDVIQSTYRAYKSADCPEQMMDKYLQCFRTSRNYDIESLVRDINLESQNNAFKSTQVPKTHLEGSMNDSSKTHYDSSFMVGIRLAFHEVVGRCAEESEVEKIIEIANDPIQLVSMLYIEDIVSDENDKLSGEKPSQANATFGALPVGLLFNEQQLNAFETVFKRPMHIQEYFKYVIDRNNASISDFKPLFDSHVSLFNRLRQVVETYVGTELEEYTYVKNYLYKVDEPEFFFNIVDSIVDSDLYKTNMKAHLKERYAKLFDENLDCSDIDYVFAKVKERKLSLCDEEIQTVLVDLKTETDEITSHVFDQFNRVLERQPDETETNKHINSYRGKLPRELASIDQDTEKMLMSSLEFHDIVKKRIRRAFISKHGKDLAVSVLYDCLSKVLAEIQKCTMASLDDFIHQSF